MLLPCVPVYSLNHNSVLPCLSKNAFYMRPALSWFLFLNSDLHFYQIHHSCLFPQCSEFLGYVFTSAISIDCPQPGSSFFLFPSISADTHVHIYKCKLGFPGQLSPRRNLGSWDSHTTMLELCPHPSSQDSQCIFKLILFQEVSCPPQQPTASVLSFGSSSWEGSGPMEQPML
jgi:hypothetical protein